jgi:hypothetical protein
MVNTIFVDAAHSNDVVGLPWVVVVVVVVLA